MATYEQGGEFAGMPSPELADYLRTAAAVLTDTGQFFGISGGISGIQPWQSAAVESRSRELLDAAGGPDAYRDICSEIMGLKAKTSTGRISAKVYEAGVETLRSASCMLTVAESRRLLPVAATPQDDMFLEGDELQMPQAFAPELLAHLARQTVAIHRILFEQRPVDYVTAPPPGRYQIARAVIVGNTDRLQAVLAETAPEAKPYIIDEFLNSPALYAEVPQPATEGPPVGMLQPAGSSADFQPGSFPPSNNLDPRVAIHAESTLRALEQLGVTAGAVPGIARLEVYQALPLYTCGEITQRLSADVASKIIDRNVNMLGYYMLYRAIVLPGHEDMSVAVPSFARRDVLLKVGHRLFAGFYGKVGSITALRMPFEESFGLDLPAAYNSERACRMLVMADVHLGARKSQRLAEVAIYEENAKKGVILHRGVNVSKGPVGIVNRKGSEYIMHNSQAVARILRPEI